MRSTTTTPKLQRADAQRNYDALLEAGKSIFARSGTDAPLEEVAREAGVGKGTLYRHFPTREHLFVAILQDRVDYLGENTSRETVFLGRSGENLQLFFARVLSSDRTP